MAKWIDFKELRARLRFEDVLRYYKVEPKVRGKQHHGFCPLPTHQGKRNSPSFSVNLEKGIFHCFGCQAKGNVIDFACLMEGLNPESGSDFRKAALILNRAFGGGDPDEGEREGEKRSDKTSTKTEPAGKREESEEAGEVVVNAPLDFELKKLDPSHPYLFDRGFTKETIAHFGLGYCSRGMFKERIAIPIHDAEGKLVAYAGRLVDDKSVGEESPKYKFPPHRQHDGKTFDFKKSLIVYNRSRLDPPVKDLIVVEGFPSVWWLWQAGYANVVAIMGSSMSEQQVDLIVQAVAPDGRIWVFGDGDAPGHKCSQAILVRLATERAVRWIKLSEGRQPTDCQQEELDELLAGIRA